MRNVLPVPRRAGRQWWAVSPGPETGTRGVRGRRRRGLRRVRGGARFLMMERPLAGEVVNIGCGGRIRLLDVLEQMGRVLGKSVDPEFAPPRAGDVRHSSADIGRARALLGYEPVVAFGEGIERTLAWARSEGAAR